jgi:LacI family transcriptional regulator
MPTRDKEKRIAVYLPATADYSRRLAMGVRQYCTEHEGLLWRDFWFAPELGYVDASRGDPPWTAWKPDGLIAHAWHPEVDVEWLKAGVPHVVVTTSDCTADVMPVVHVDQASIAALAVRHFLELGRGHFAYVGLARYNGSVRGRRLFAEELARQGHSLLHYDLPISFGKGLFFQENTTDTEPGLLDFLRASPKPLALLASTDAVAREVCDGCLAVGLAVPDDVAILGLGNTILTEATVPSLSSIEPPGEVVGFEAAALVHRLLRGEPPPREAVLAPATKLIARQSTTGSRHNPDVERALQLVREQDGRGMRVGDLARRLSVSRSYLEQEFARVVGHTPGEEIRMARLRRAEELLLKSNHTITQIAGMLGFDRTGNFSEFFRKHCGMSPRSYRQAKREPGKKEP